MGAVPLILDIRIAQKTLTAKFCRNSEIFNAWLRWTVAFCAPVCPLNILASKLALAAGKFTGLWHSGGAGVQKDMGSDCPRLLHAEDCFKQCWTWSGSTLQPV